MIRERALAEIVAPPNSMSVEARILLGLHT